MPSVTRLQREEALYRLVEVGQPIPVDLYAAVAAIRRHERQHREHHAIGVASDDGWIKPPHALHRQITGD